jgi:uncharacterized protein YjbI with pentapeptide repeats
MANPGHLQILRQGLEVWARWRRENCEISPDLSSTILNGTILSGVDFNNVDLRFVNLTDADLICANLTGADLYMADLSKANLSGADMRGANLYQVKLSDTILSGADLRGASFGGTSLAEATLNKANLSGLNLRRNFLVKANLKDANLSGAVLFKADLSGADLSGATLFRANLTDAKLNGADLHRAYLSGATLFKANLTDSRLSGAYFSGADLSGANLVGSDINGADLSNANLIGAVFIDSDLRGANLSNAALQTALLIDAKLDGAHLTGACLWETQRAGWSIKDILCEWVYWDKDAQVKSSYDPGDFERLFADKTRVKLFFKNGISPLEVATLPALIKHLEEVHPGCALRLVSIHDDAGGAVVELAIEGDEEKSPLQMKELLAALEDEAQQRIKYQRQALVEREARLQLEGEVRQLDSVVDKLIRHHTINVQPGGRMGDEYNIAGQAGAVGPNSEAHDNTFNQLVSHVEQHIDLAELAKQLGELRQAIMQKQDLSPESAIAIGEVARAELAAKEKNTGKVVEHLKAAGKWTLDFAKEVGKDLVVEVIKGATGLP